MPGIPITQTKASMNGMHYTAANGSLIRNLGEKRISGVDANGQPLSITVQCADVRKPLGPVGRMCDADNRVVFDNEGSYIINKKTRKVTPMVKENGVYTFELWVPGDEQVEKPINSISKSSKSGFTWLDDEAW